MSDYTVVELRQKLKEKGIKGYSKLRKAELVELYTKSTKTKPVYKELVIPEHKPYKSKLDVEYEDIIKKQPKAIQQPIQPIKDINKLNNDINDIEKSSIIFNERFPVNDIPSMIKSFEKKLEEIKETLDYKRGKGVKYNKKMEEVKSYTDAIKLSEEDYKIRKPIRDKKIKELHELYLLRLELLLNKYDINKDVSSKDKYNWLKRIKFGELMKHYNEYTRVIDD